MKRSKHEIEEIAKIYARNTKTKYMYLEFAKVLPSTYAPGYWDALFIVRDPEGNEIDGPLLMAIHDKDGTIHTMEDIIMKQR